MIFERYKREVGAARRIVRGEFAVVAHNGMAHADDTIAVALLRRAGAKAVYRLGQLEDINAVLKEHDRVIIVDVGNKWYDRLKAHGDRVAVLDHHAPAGEPEYQMLPSSLMQVVEALDLAAPPRIQMLFTAVDLVDRYGPQAKRWLGMYGTSLNYGLTSYLFASTPSGEVRDVAFLDAIAKFVDDFVDVENEEYSRAYGAVSVPPNAERYPRALGLYRLIAMAAEDISVVYSREAFQTGFGIDFGTHAALTPKLAGYINKGLEKHSEEALKAVSIVEQGRYSLVNRGPIAAIVTEESASPAMLYNAYVDLHLASGPTVVVVKDLRTPGGYVLWRPDEYKDVIDFRRLLSGKNPVFVHQSGFMAVVKASSAEEAAKSI